MHRLSVNCNIRFQRGGCAAGATQCASENRAPVAEALADNMAMSGKESEILAADAIQKVRLGKP
jgi:hypothetical protein